jgi:hemerythrin superfamily protein
VRDDSFFRNFARYHDTLDHQVKPVPINRFSRLGLQQTVNALFCAGVINYLSDKKGRPIYLKQDFKSITDSDLRDLVTFITNVYGRTAIDIDVNKEVEDRINQIRNSKDGDKEYFPNIFKIAVNISSGILQA